MLSGRAFQQTDIAGGQPVVLINRALANTVFAGTDPIGRRIRVVNPEYANDWRTIVGVVGDMQYRRLDADMVPTIYTPFSQTPFMWAYVMVRTTGDPSALTRSIKDIVRSVDPNVVAASVRPMTEVVSGTVAEPRLSMLLVSGFALLALTLASVGIYGVIAYSVSQRTHELGLRMALGAGRAGVLAMIIREGVVMAAIGIVYGPRRGGAGDTPDERPARRHHATGSADLRGWRAPAPDDCGRGQLPSRAARDTGGSYGRFTGGVKPVKSQIPTPNSQGESFARIRVKDVAASSFARLSPGSFDRLSLGVGIRDLGFEVIP